MSKLAFISAACLAAFALAACSSLDKAATFIDQPNVQQALATVKTVSKALICDVSAGSEIAKAIESRARAHQGVTDLVDVSSTAVCTALQGSVVPGVTEANVPAVTAVPK